MTQAPGSAERKQAIVASISSDIGTALAAAWLRKGWGVAGTYRTWSPAVSELREAGALVTPCDLADAGSVHAACRTLCASTNGWDVLVLGAGTQEPVGNFAEVEFDAWETSLRVNFNAQLRLVHALLPSRRLSHQRTPTVIFFAGGGTNNAPTCYSAYVISKIASIKMCELLDAEVPDTKFSILGPGWVKTKIHQATVRAGAGAGANYQKTVDFLSSGTGTPVERVVECCNWIIEAPRTTVGGRNFSVVHDRWGEQALAERLGREPDLFKLRRCGN